jgi:hypothetical protein
MLSLNYNKGQRCFIKPLLCQEGFCNECVIYLEKLEHKVTSVIDKISIVEHQNFDPSLAECDRV